MPVDSVMPAHTELEKAFEKSFEKQPISSSWGFFAYDDTPGDKGGGSGNFSWFDSQDDVIAFLNKYPLLAHSSDAQFGDQFAKAAEFVAQLTEDTFDQEAVDKLNQIIKGVEQIQWFGQLNDLLSDEENEFAQFMRNIYAGAPDKLPKTKIPEFVEVLRKYGH